MIRTANLIGSISRKAGGLHESVRRLVQCVAEKGVGVRVLAVEDEFTQRDKASWAPVQLDVFPSSWPEAFGYSSGFLKSLNEHRPDLTHTHGIWMYPSIATTAYCNRRRLPYMISPHGMLDPWAVRHQRWKKVLAYALYESNHVRGARCLRALCASEAQAIRKMGLKNPIAVIPNGIDLPEVGTGSGEHGNAPWNGMVEPGKKVLLFLSRIHPKKGLINLIKAWGKTRNAERGARKGEEWVLAIAGWDQGGHEEELKRLCDELGIAWRDVRGQRTGNGEDPTAKSQERMEDGGWRIANIEQPTSNIEHRPTNSEEPTSNIEHRTSDNQHPTSNEASLLFLGPQFGDDKAACYANCDAFILPSFSEGLPMVVLEAWAYGKPVLMTNECNLPEGFAAGAAFRVDTTVQGIAEGLQTLCRGSEMERIEMGRRGRQLVQERFTWDTIADQLKVTYEWMLGGGSAPAWILNR